MAAESGQSRSAATETGRTSAAKFVRQRGERRVGRAAPLQVAGGEPSATAAIARCSAPCRKSVRPRSSQASSTTAVAIPTGRLAACGRKMRESGASRATRSSARSRGRATPVPLKSGARARPSLTRPRRSGTRLTAAGGAGITPSLTEPSRRANAQKRSLAITTPSARAIPPRRGSSAACSALRRTEMTPARSTQTGSRQASRPASAGRPTSKAYWSYQRPLPTTATKEAEQQQHENDDQDDVENPHRQPPCGLHELRRSLPVSKQP